MAEVVPNVCLPVTSYASPEPGRPDSGPPGPNFGGPGPGPGGTIHNPECQTGLDFGPILDFSFDALGSAPELIFVDFRSVFRAGAVRNGPGQTLAGNLPQIDQN